MYHIRILYTGISTFVDPCTLNANKIWTVKDAYFSLILLVPAVLYILSWMHNLHDIPSVEQTDMKD